MFKIYDGREYFYQWDLDRKLIVEDLEVREVHFTNRATNDAYVCETYVEDGKTLVNVPNILLQTNWRIQAYAYDGKHTKHEKCYEVKSRSKPNDYAYTETEILNWSAIDAKVKAAIEAAEEATEEAKVAAGSVNTAIENTVAAIGVAYEAADLANQAAADANGAAANANKAADNANATVNSINDKFANALKGNKSGAAIGITDISPIEHNVEVKLSSDTVTDFSEVTLNVFGKNLFDFSVNKFFTQQEDGSYANNQALSVAQKNSIYLPFGTYTVSYDVKCPVKADVRLAFIDKDGAVTTKWIAGTGEFVHNSHTITGEFVQWYVNYGATPKEANTVFIKNIQLEVGSTETSYEPYIEPISYQVATDGTVEGVTSIYPNMSITTDTTGVVIDAEYNKDINKAFAELQNALISLGGNV